MSARGDFHRRLRLAADEYDRVMAELDRDPQVVAALAELADVNRRLAVVDRRIGRAHRQVRRQARRVLWRSFWRGFTHPFGRRP